MFDLLAAAPADGCAFVKNGKEILLVRPPYQRWNLSVVPESSVEKAVSTYGFESAEGSFNDWGSLIAFLEKRMVEERKARGQEIPTSESIKALVKLAPKDILNDYLKRVESELLPNREWDAASDLLVTLLRVDTIENDPDLRTRTLDLLDRCRSERAKVGAQERELMNEEENLVRLFPIAAEQHGTAPLNRYSREVADRGQLLAVGR